MPKFAANLSMLFTEHPFLDRFELAARAGFTAVEFLFPYDFPVDEIKRRLVANRLELVLHNLPAGDWAAGERGIACLPDRVAEFRDGVAQAIRYATALGVPRVNCLVGKTPAGVSAETVRRTLVGNLRFAAAALKEVDIQLLIEPVNTFDIPGFHLSRTDAALALIDEVANDPRADNLYVQYDLYHAQRMEGELIATLTRQLARIGHVQIADNPGRHEPGTGEIAYDRVFAALDRIGYAGWIGCEYKPATTTEAGLHWLDTATRKSA